MAQAKGDGNDSAQSVLPTSVNPAHLMHLITNSTIQKQVGRQEWLQYPATLESTGRAGRNGSGRDRTGFTFLVNSETEFIIAELWLLHRFFFLGDVRKENRHFHQFITEQRHIDIASSHHCPLCPFEQLDPLPFNF